MASSITPSCVVINQQQQENIYQHQQSVDQVPEATPVKVKPNKCTIVENGRVVVKPITPTQG